MPARHVVVGLGQHRRIKHPISSNDQVDVERSRRRWLPEEVRLMAQMEAEATKDDVVNMNKHLAALKPDRSLAAIKGKRRDQSYRVQVASLIESLQSDRNTEQNPDIDVEMISEDQLSQRVSLNEEIRKSVAQMSRIRNKYARALQGLGEAALRGEHMDEYVFTQTIMPLFNATSTPKGLIHSKVV